MPVLFVFCAVFAVGAWAVLWRNSSLLIPTVARGSRKKPGVALTFDDGPDPRITPVVLDILAQEGVRATFFCVGDLAQRHPDLVRRIHAEGHLIGNHSREHDWRMNLWHPRRVGRSMARCQRILERLTGYRPRFYRAPVGIKSPAQALVGWRLGMTFVGWTRSAHDGGGFLLRPAALRRLAARSRPGDIILLHDGKWQIADRDSLIRATTKTYASDLQALITHIRARGLNPVRLDELLGISGALEPSASRPLLRGFAGGWFGTCRRLCRYLKTEHATPYKLALATAVGVFVGSSPLFGLHALLGLACAVRLRLNKLAVFLGTNISNPVTGPFVIFLNIQTGCRLLTGHWFGFSPGQFHDMSIRSVSGKILIYWTVGFPVASSLLAVLTVLVSYPVYRVLRAHRD